MNSVFERRTPLGRSYSVSPFAWSLDPGPGAASLTSESVVRQLRRARDRGITTFDLVESRYPVVAEGRLGAAFPAHDPDLVTILRCDPTSMVAAKPGPGTPLAGRIGSALDASKARLGGASQIVVEWTGPLDPKSPGKDALEALEDLRREGEILDVAVPAALSEETSDRRGARSGPLLSGPFSLLHPDPAARMPEGSQEPTVSWIARDVFAGGRLDGTAVAARAGPGAGPPVPPSLRTLEAEFQPVLELGFLTSRRQRTLAQAALHFVLRWPWVVVASIPFPVPERWEELLAVGRSTPLSDEEVRGVFERAMSHGSQAKG